MGEMLDKFNPPDLIALVVALGGLVAGAIVAVAYLWSRVRIVETEACLKQQMVEKGISPAEIEQVSKATKGPPGPTGNAAMDKAALIQMLADHGYEGEDIERVLKAYGET